jgi:HTH-type transcriptional regulator/antitoxin HigA
MEIRVIKNDTQYHSMLREAEHLVSLDPNPDSREAERLELLSVLIEDFEKRSFPFDVPDPIEAIEFRMNEQGLRQVDLAPLLGSRSRVSEILSRKRPLTVPMIRSISTGLGIPYEILLAERSTGPHSKSAKIDEEKYDWDKFPIKEMVRRGWINFDAPSKITSSIKKAAAESLKTFLQQAYNNAAAPSLFRRSFRGDILDEKSFYSTLAWSARVLARAKQLEKKYKKFDPSTLDEEFFVKIARLSRSPEGPRKVIGVLGAKGIALVIEPKLPNTLLDGAAMLSENGMPVIGMTLRYDRVDYFWFTLLHELAHIWKHISSSDEAFIDRVENTSPSGLAEKQANRIARDALIPRAIWKRSQAFMNPSRESILQLAELLSIHPAIIVGRLHKENEKYNMFRELLGEGSVQSLFPEITF